MDLWGGRSDRRFFGESHWNEPLRWNAEAAAAGVRYRVFCASMSDVFEARRDLDTWRSRLWGLIEATQHLDWLLLTKRPEQISSKVPWGRRWPHNVWLGCTIENQLWASRRVPLLIQHPAVVRFVSCEPLLGPLDIASWLGSTSTRNGIDWVIAGGESGSKARIMNPRWARDLKDQCIRATVPFHFKQWGNWRPDQQEGRHFAQRVQLPDKGKFLTVVRMSKKLAGRDLDGRTWDDVPQPRKVA